jgi:hypothetical protein
LEFAVNASPTRRTALQVELRRLALLAGDLSGRAGAEVEAMAGRLDHDLESMARHYLFALRDQGLIIEGEAALLASAANVLKTDPDRQRAASEIARLCGNLASGGEGASLVAIMIATIAIEASRRAALEPPPARPPLYAVAGSAFGAHYAAAAGLPGSIAGGIAAAIGASLPVEP